MKLLFITDPLESFKIYKDTTFAMMREAQRRGHTLAVCLPSFVVIYLISLVFDRFLQLSAVASAFRGIQVCVIYLILSAGMKMLKSLSGTAFNRIIVAGVVAAMVGCSVAAVSFSSLYYILLCGAAGVLLYLLKKLRKEEKA